MRKLIISATFSIFATIPVQAQVVESVVGGLGGAALCSGMGHPVRCRQVTVISGSVIIILFQVQLTRRIYPI